MLTKMHITRVENTLACDLLLIFVKSSRKGVSPIWQLRDWSKFPSKQFCNKTTIKKYDILAEQMEDNVTHDKSKSKCHGCGELGHWVRDCLKGYNNDWLTTQQCFKCGQLGHSRRDGLFKMTRPKHKPSSICGGKKHTPKRYHPSTALQKMIGVLNSYDLHSSDNYMPLSVYNSNPKTTIRAVVQVLKWQN